MYAIYGSNYDNAMDYLDEVEEKEWFKKIVPKKVTLESLLITPIQRIPRYELLLEDLLKHTPLDHPDSLSLVTAVKDMHDVAEHVNSTMKKLKDSEKLAQEGFVHLLAPSRSLIMDGFLEVLSISHPLGPDHWTSAVPTNGNTPINGSGRTGEYKFMLFNDILVHVDISSSSSFLPRLTKPKTITKSTSRSKLKKQNSKKFTKSIIVNNPNNSPTSNSNNPNNSVNSNSNNLNNQNSSSSNTSTTTSQSNSGTSTPVTTQIIGTEKKYDEWIWPLHLVWLVDGSKTGFDIVGPNKVISVMADSKQSKINWFNALKSQIDSRLMMLSKINNIKDDVSDLSINLKDRQGTYTLSYLQPIDEMPSSTSSSDKKNYSLHLSLTQTTYSGTWSNGIMNGNGGILQHFGNRYMCNFENGKMIGDGTISFFDGSIYVGHIKDGKPDGYGEFTSSGGAHTYVGQWKDGAHHGVGDAIWYNDEISKDTDNNDTNNNSELSSSSSGSSLSLSSSASLRSYDSYVGEWHQNHMQGKGVYKSTVQGTRHLSYEGDFQNSVFDGDGYLETTIGIYQGHFTSGLRSGHGTYKFLTLPHCDHNNVYGNNNFEEFSYSNISYYEGNWEEDRWHGKGTFFNISNGTVYQGDFVKGKREGKGRLTFLNNTKNNHNNAYYNGSWKDGRPHGDGTLSTNEMRYEGDWESGKMQGKGCIYFSNGSKWEGTFTNNKPNGNGKFTLKSGMVIQSKWKVGNRGESKFVVVPPNSNVSLSFDKEGYEDVSGAEFQPPEIVPYLFNNLLQIIISE
eukprot:TRINITY_DN1931_c0_g1_i3.p1 TRINITY_DN1931_c0_g1~~TRINITY_DN1931_c0_g1_i3.p1  ORF type:complete len:789 (+),score=201.46 TRINITY_DN1931_c0_g1_i3:526-2892(+)